MISAIDAYARKQLALDAFHTACGIGDWPKETNGNLCLYAAVKFGNACPFAIDSDQISAMIAIQTRLFQAYHAVIETQYDNIKTSIHM